MTSPFLKWGDISRGNPLPVTIESGLVPESYDFISLTYTGSDVTGVVYKSGGPDGTVIATLSITYVGGNISTVTRT